MIKIFQKDLKLFLKDRRALLFAFLLPIILISLFAFAFGGIGGGDSKPNPISLLITDEDKSPTTDKIIANFDSMQSLAVRLESLEKSKELVTKGKYVGVLVFYKGFQDSLQMGKKLPMEMFYDKAQEMQIGLLQPALINALMKIRVGGNVTNPVETYLNSNFPNIDKGLRTKIVHDMTAGEAKSKGNSLSLDSKVKMTSLVGEKKDNSLYLIQAIAGVAIMMLLFSITSLSVGMIEERESGTLKRLLYSPIEPVSILFGKMIMAMVLSICQLSVMFVFAWLAFGLDISKNLPALVLMVFSTAFAISGIGIFLASLAKSRAQAQGMGTLVILTMSALGGSMVPLFIMPAIMQKIALFTVNYWGIQGFYDIFWRGLPTMEILPRVMVLLAIGTFLTIISLRLFKRNVSKLA